MIAVVTIAVTVCVDYLLPLGARSGRGEGTARRAATPVRSRPRVPAPRSSEDGDPRTGAALPGRQARLTVSGGPDARHRDSPRTDPSHRVPVGTSSV